MEQKSPQKVTIPDEAISYIVNAYLEEKLTTSGITALVGLSAPAVTQVLKHFIDWAALNNYIKDGVLTIGSKK